MEDDFGSITFKLEPQCSGVRLPWKLEAQPGGLRSADEHLPSEHGAVRSRDGQGEAAGGTAFEDELRIPAEEEVRRGEDDGDGGDFPGGAEPGSCEEGGVHFRPPPFAATDFAELSRICSR